jgi:hypothetical protein
MYYPIVTRKGADVMLPRKSNMCNNILKWVSIITLFLSTFSELLCCKLASVSLRSVVNFARSYWKPTFHKDSSVTTVCLTFHCSLTHLGYSLLASSPRKPRHHWFKLQPPNQRTELYLETLFHHFPEWTEENHEILQEEYLKSVPRLEPGLFAIEARILITWA